MFFTPAEAATIEAVADRFIPPDETTAGGKDAGCAVFVDRQLAGPYGSRRGLYVSPPFLKGEKNQGPQDQDNPAAIYRKALAALDAYARQHKGDIFARLSPSDQDEILKGLERGDVKLEGVDGQSFFETLLKAIQEGFFADPIYGGNRDMCAWKMIGFPGARYDYRDWIGRHNQRFPLQPGQHNRARPIGRRSRRPEASQCPESCQARMSWSLALAGPDRSSRTN